MWNPLKHNHSWKNFEHSYWNDYYGVSDGSHQYCEKCDYTRFLGYNMDTLYWHYQEQISKAWAARVAYPPYLIWFESRCGYWTFVDGKKTWKSLAWWLKK